MLHPAFMALRASITGALLLFSLSAFALNCPADRIDEQVRVSDPLVAETILRIVQEAMTNAARHSDASTLSVALHHQGDELLLDIHDDGRLRGSLREGNGLAGMRERVIAADGKLQLGQTAHGGLRLQVSLPA